MPATMVTCSAGTPVLSGHDSGVTELTDDAHRMIRTVLRAVQGMGDSAEEADPYVSTGRAAEIL